MTGDEHVDERVELEGMEEGEVNLEKILGGSYTVGRGEEPAAYGGSMGHGEGDLVSDVLWVYSNMDEEPLVRADAPTRSSWSLMRWVKENARNRNKFFELLLPRAHGQAESRTGRGEWYEEEELGVEEIRGVLARYEENPYVAVGAEVLRELMEYERGFVREDLEVRGRAEPSVVKPPVSRPSGVGVAGAGSGSVPGVKTRPEPEAESESEVGTVEGGLGRSLPPPPVIPWKGAIVESVQRLDATREARPGSGRLLLVGGGSAAKSKPKPVDKPAAAVKSKPQPKPAESAKELELQPVAKRQPAVSVVKRDNRYPGGWVGGGFLLEDDE